MAGGNSANYNWFSSSKNIGIINNLRKGESIFLVFEVLYRKPSLGLFTDVITLTAKVIESKIKPSDSYGKMGQNFFSKTRVFPNLGHRNRAILNIGVQDVSVDGLTTRKHIKILGASGDHIIVDSSLVNLNVGNQLNFSLNYAPFLSVMTSPYVIKLKKRS